MVRWDKWLVAEKLRCTNRRLVITTVIISHSFTIDWSMRTIESSHSWVLRIAKVGYFFSPSLLNVERSILGPLLFLFYQKSFIFRFLENCFWGLNLHNALGWNNMLTLFELVFIIFYSSPNCNSACFFALS